MLRVLHCIYDDPENPWVGGGGALRVREIYRRLTDEVEATVVTGNFPGAEDGVRDGVRYLRLGAEKPYALGRLSYAAGATRMLAREDYDVGIFDYSVYTPLHLPRHRRIGLVVHMLHAPTARGRWGRIGASLLARRELAGIRAARWISTTSRWMVEQLQPLVRRDTRIVSVGSGVPPEFTAVRRDEQDFLLYYGRLDIYQKGLDTLIDAYRRLRESSPVPRLLIAGRGKDSGRLREMLAASGLLEAVEIRANPDRGAVLELMSGAIALVMPSRLEGLPMVPAEAMAAGVPVVASDVGAMSEIVVDGTTGILIPPNDSLRLADAMRRLWADPTLRDRMSAEARRSAERFSWNRVARAHLEYLTSIAGESDRHAPAPQGA